jgi:hypothetical protein
MISLPLPCRTEDEHGFAGTSGTSREVKELLRPRICEDGIDGSPGHQKERARVRSDGAEVAARYVIAAARKRELTFRVDARPRAPAPAPQR